MEVLLLLKSWEYKNLPNQYTLTLSVLLLLKSWEYKNVRLVIAESWLVLLLLKSWEYKNEHNLTVEWTAPCQVDNEIIKD